MELINGLTHECTKETGSPIKCTAKEYSPGAMVEGTLLKKRYEGEYQNDKKEG
jgi:hypothetical protein